MNVCLGPARELSHGSVERIQSAADLQLLIVGVIQMLGTLESMPV
jgi:hypothetical protein